MECNYHFTRDGLNRKNLYRRLYGFSWEDRWKDANAEQRFHSILEQKIIKANQDKGYFAPEVYPNVALARQEFSELTPLVERTSKYALCFREEVFKGRITMRVLYLDYEEIINNDWEPEDRWLIELYGSSRDFRWENELRCVGDLNFEYKSILFLMAPEIKTKEVQEKYKIKVFPAEAINDSRKEEVEEYIRKNQ